MEINPLINNGLVEIWRIFRKKFRISTYRSELLSLKLTKVNVMGRMSLRGNLALTDRLRRQLANPLGSKVYRFENQDGADFDLILGGGRTNILADSVSVQSNGLVDLEGL